MPDVSGQSDSPSPDQVSTLVRGVTTTLSTDGGEIRPEALLGVFHLDERLISSLLVTVDGARPPLLSSQRTGASSERIASLAALDQYRNGQALLVRRRAVSVGRMSESIELRSFSTARTVELDVALQSDGSSILRLKSGRPPRDPVAWLIEPSGQSAVAPGRDGAAFVRVEADQSATMSCDGPSLHLSWKPELVANGVWTGSWSVSSAVLVASSRPASLSAVPPLTVVADDHRWGRAIESSVADLDALVIDLPAEGHRFIGAGAPWYLAMFGRDSLIAAWETLPLGTDLSLDVLDTLAAHQGTVSDARTIQEPGKILHERRVGAPQVFGMRQGDTYYGSVDSSPLFVMLLAEAYRWGAPVERVRALLPAARAAMQWCRSSASLTAGAGREPFLWYTSDAAGLGNQGWKDSGDCMVHADGSLATGPFAVAEAQAYYFEALNGLARLERDLGGGDGAAAAVELEAVASGLARAFEESFWLPDEPSGGLLALALDGAGRPLRVATSNMGQCLWSGILREEVAAQVSARTLAGDLLTPWGVRTLGDHERAYNPLGYHLGTVWAHDSAIVAAGMARHGQGAASVVLTKGLLAAAESFDWRLPELYGGLDTSVDGSPLPYPAACSPQAWSAGAPLLLLRAALGLSPDVPAGTVTLRPMLPAGERLRVDGLRLGPSGAVGPVSIEVRGDSVIAVEGLGPLRVV